MTDFVKPVSNYNLANNRQVQITDSLELYVAGDLMPLSVVESGYFSNFVKHLDSRYQLPCRKYLSSQLLEQKSTSVQADLKKNLQRVSNICLTFDHWSIRQIKSFLGTTGNFILDLNMQPAILACKHVKGRHTSENIHLEYEEAVSSYEISGKITTIVTDNASIRLREKLMTDESDS